MENMYTAHAKSCSKGWFGFVQVDEEQFKKIMNYIDQGKAEGAKLNCGGKRKGDKGFYVEPTVFSEV